MARGMTWSQTKLLLKSMTKLFSSMFSPQGSLRSELEDKEQGQKLRRIPEEKRERKPKEKGNYSWENVKQLYSFNFFTTDFVYRNT